MGPEHRLVHLGLQRPGGDLVFLNDVDDDAHARHGIPVHRVQHGLRNSFKQVFWIHVGLPERLTHPIHLFRAGTTDYKVISHHGTANEVQRANEGLEGLRVQASNDRLCVVGTEPVAGVRVQNAKHWLSHMPVQTREGPALCSPFPFSWHLAMSKMCSPSSLTSPPPGSPSLPSFFENSAFSISLLIQPGLHSFCTFILLPL